LTLYPVHLTCHLFLHYQNYLWSDKTLIPTLLSHLEKQAEQDAILAAQVIVPTVLDFKSPADLISPYSLKVQSLFWTTFLTNSFLYKENAELIAKMFKLYCKTTQPNI